MQNHFYTYDNVIRKQTKGGAIGLKLTEKLGRLLMKRHDKKYTQLLKKLDIREEIFDRYVDDETEGLAALDPGVRFEDGKLVMNEDKIEEDERKAEDERTFEVLKAIGNSIFDCIQFTIDVPSLNESGKLPVLDLNLRVVNDQFEHEFFEKPCTSETVIPFTSAHSRKMKMAVLVEEGVRRLRNHSRRLEWERSRRVMEDWSRKLRRSGYPGTMRHEVIKAAVDRYDKMCMEEDEGIRPIHRPRSWKEKERRREKELKRTNWHQSKDNQVSAPLILDPTAGEMTKDMKVVCKDFETVTGWRIPVVERAGRAMRSMAKAEPLKRKGCQRDDCFPCTTDLCSRIFDLCSRTFNQYQRDIALRIFDLCSRIFDLCSRIFYQYQSNIIFRIFCVIFHQDRRLCNLTISCIAPKAQISRDVISIFSLQPHSQMLEVIIH